MNGLEPTQIKMIPFQTLPTCSLYSVSFEVVIAKTEAYFDPRP